MKKQSKRSFAPAITLLLAVIAVTWHFTRQHAGTRDEVVKSSNPTITQTKTGERSAPDPERERRRQASISTAAQKWYEELLEKFPRMKPDYRDVPDAENGFLQLLLLAESTREPRCSDDLSDMLMGGTDWDAAKFKLWLADNQDYLAEIMRVAGLPDQSCKGLEIDRIFQNNRVIGEFRKVLLGATRLAFESGDQEAALRYAQASLRLSDHLTDVEVLSTLAEVHAAGNRVGLHDLFLEEIFPTLSDNPQALESWRDVLVRKESSSSEYARALTGEWNVTMRTQILPTLLGAHTPMLGEEPFRAPDSERFFELYTAAVEKFAASIASAGPDRLEMSQSEIEFPESGIDPQTLKMLHDTAFPFRSIYKALGNIMTRTTMASAAISLQLGEAPPNDPVSGKPFLWDVASRTLSAPEGVEGVDPIKLR